MKNGKGSLQELLSNPADTDDLADWSGRMMWRRNRRTVQSVYLPNQPSTYGADSDWNVRFVPGRWHTVERRIVVNTLRRHDGVLQTWFDGKLTLLVTDFRFRNTSRLSIDRLYFLRFSAETVRNR